MTKKKMDTAAILRTLAQIRESIPRPAGLPPAPRHDTRHDGRMPMPIRARTVEDFEMLAVADALQSLSDELTETANEAERKVFEQAMDTYYAAEDLVRDGAHPELVPHVEALREAYQKSYGRPIPPRERREEARKDLEQFLKRK